MLPAVPGLVAAVWTRLREALGGDDRAALVEVLEAPAVRVDGDGHVVDCNRRGAAVLDVERGAATGRPLAALAPALDGAADGDVVELAVDGDDRLFAATVHPTDDGRWLVLDDVTDAEGHRRPAAGGADPADRDGDSGRYETVFETAPVGVFVLDAEGTVESANERAASLLGFDPGALAGTTVGELRGRGVVDAGFPDPAAVGDRPAGEAGDAAGRHRRHEVTVRPADGGDERVVQVGLAPLPGGGVVGVLRDVTERQRRLDELEQYEAIMEVLPDPVYATDAEGRLTFVNRAFEEQLGYPREEGGLHFSEFTTAEDTEAVLELLRSMVDGGPDRATAEIVVVTSDGRQRRVEDSIALLPADGEFDGSAGVLRDVTERRRRQEVVTVMNRALRHNLRTNVASIVGHADLLDREVDGEAETYVERIRDASDWLAELGDSLRTLQRAIESDVADDGGVPVREVVDVVVDDAREAHPHADLAVHVATSGTLEVGRPLAYALENVVENAVVHSDRERPSVDVWVADAPREGWVDVHVEDDGPGVPERERDVVLGDAAITQLQHGSGLGLWLTRWLVELFDGELVIADNDPRGTVVTLRLPRSSSAG